MTQNKTVCGIVQFTSTTQPKDVITQDYNYRTADVDQYSQVNTDAKDGTTVGTDYRYGEHYKHQGDEHTIESSHWYVNIRMSTISAVKPFFMASVMNKDNELLLIIVE